MQSSGIFCSSWHIFTPFFPVSDAKIWVFEGLRARQTLQWRLNPQALKIYIILNHIMQTVDVLWRHSDVFLWCYAISSSVSERRGERKYPNDLERVPVSYWRSLRGKMIENWWILYSARDSHEFVPEGRIILHSFLRSKSTIRVI